MPASPLVSVVLDNFNYARFLPDAVESVLAQSYGHLDIIVVDDGSTDDSLRVLERYGDRLRVIAKSNGGQGSAFNAGIASSAGSIVCFLDADDIWHRRKVERIVDVLMRRPDCGWLRHELAVADDALAPLGLRVPQISRPGTERPSRRTMLEQAIGVATSALVLRREVAQRIFPIPDGLLGALRYDADYYVLMALGAQRVTGYSLNEVLGTYRRHPHQIAASTDYLVERVSRMAEVAEHASRAWNAMTSSAGVSTVVYKQRLTLLHLQGCATFGLRRWKLLACGLREVFRIAADDVRLAARQLAALLRCFVVPWRTVANLRPGGRSGPWRPSPT